MGAAGAGLPLHVELLGPEPGAATDTFVLLHGYAGSTFSWRHWAPRLAALGRVLLVDLKGFGRAPRPDDDRYGPAHQAELVHRLLEQRDVRNLTLVGHSLGGAVALRVALRLQESDPSRLERLVIVSGAAYRQRVPPFVRLAEWSAVRLTLGVLGVRWLVPGVLRSVVYDRDTVSPDQIRGYADPLAAPGTVRTLVATARQIVPPDLDAITLRYREIRVPSVLLWGSHDRVVPVAVGRRLAEELPDARLHVLDRCGHLPAEERPETSWRILARFLRDTEDRA